MHHHQSVDLLTTNFLTHRLPRAAALRASALISASSFPLVIFQSSNPPSPPPSLRPGSGAGASYQNGRIPQVQGKSHRPGRSRQLAALARGPRGNFSGPPSPRRHPIQSRKLFPDRRWRVFFPIHDHPETALIQITRRNTKDFFYSY